MAIEAVTVVGTLAAAASMVAYVPQAVRVVKTRETKDLSRAAYTCTVCAFALWVTYGVLRADWPLIVTNSVCLVLAAFILTMKLLPREKRDAVAGIFTGKPTAEEDSPRATAETADPESHC